MNVKELLLDNVRGRVRNLIWNEVDSAMDGASDEAAQKGKPFDDLEKIKTLYNKTKEIYKKYEPLLKEMEKDEKKATDKV